MSSDRTERARALYEGIRAERLLWVNLTDEDLDAAMDAAEDNDDMRVYGLISYELGRRSVRGAPGV